MTVERIGQSDFADRRRRALEALQGAVGLVFAPHPHFEYLTGVTDEPRAIVMLDSTHPAERRRACLFLEPLNPERERWDGYREPITEALRAQTGFSSLFRTDVLPRMLNAAARRSRRLACLHPPAVHTAPVSPDLDVFKRVTARVPGVTIEDRGDVLPSMRAVKSSNELALIRRAIRITEAGFSAALEALRPGMNEFELQETIEHAYRSAGSRAAAFPTIVGSGVNSTVLHYVANDRPIAEGALVCIDSGAVFGGYRADVTRTVPASGTFGDRQREVYEVVLRAQRAAIGAARPGTRLDELDTAARDVIRKAGYGDCFIHSIGHHLGLETHDPAPDEPLREGAVITIEPGIYIRDEAIGVRIEDDVLVTKAGAKNLTAGIPKKIADVEKAMAG